MPRGSSLSCVSGKCSSHRGIHVASTDQRSVTSCNSHSIGVGLRASFNSAPGVRSLSTSTGLRMLIPFRMNVLSPQFTTWSPTRTKSVRPATSNFPNA